MSPSCLINCLSSGTLGPMFHPKTATGTVIPPFIIIKRFVNFLEHFGKKTLRVFATFTNLSIIFGSEV